MLSAKVIPFEVGTTAGTGPSLLLISGYVAIPGMCLSVNLPVVSPGLKAANRQRRW